MLLVEALLRCMRPPKGDASSELDGRSAHENSHTALASPRQHLALLRLVVHSLYGVATGCGLAARNVVCAKGMHHVRVEVLARVLLRGHVADCICRRVCLKRASCL